MSFFISFSHCPHVYQRKYTIFMIVFGRIINEFPNEISFLSICSPLSLLLFCTLKTFRFYYFLKNLMIVPAIAQNSQTFFSSNPSHFTPCQLFVCELSRVHVTFKLWTQWDVRVTVTVTVICHNYFNINFCLVGGMFEVETHKYTKWINCIKKGKV